MRTFLWVVVIVDQVALVLIAAARLKQFEMNEFAFKQQIAQYSGDQAKLIKRVHKNLAYIRTFQKLELIVLGSVSVALLSHLCNPSILGLVYSLVGFGVIATISKLKLVQDLATKAFERSLEFILTATEILKPALKLLGSRGSNEAVLPASQEEFTDLLRRLPSTVLNPLQRQRLESILAGEAKTVKNIMTPKKRVVIVEPSATLGPIVLTDLQKSGHGYFPVATKKGEPEGILTLSDVADLELAKQRNSVRELMSSHVAWAEEDTSLFELARAFIEEKQYIVLVRNQEGEFSGIVTIADLMKHLLGIVKE